MKVLSQILFFLVISFTMSCNSENTHVINQKNSKTSNLIYQEKSVGDVLYFKDNEINLLINNNHVNEQSIKIQKGDVNFQIRKITNEYFYKTKNIDSLELIKVLEESKDEQLFFLEIVEQTKQNLIEKYYSMNKSLPISYFSFDIIQDISIISENGKDTLHPIYSNYENSSHINPTERILFSFKKFDQHQNYKVEFIDNLFDKGKIVFNFPNEQKVLNHINKTL